LDINTHLILSIYSVTSDICSNKSTDMERDYVVAYHVCTV